MKYSKPSIERSTLVGHLLTKQSVCLSQPGCKWDDSDGCICRG